jgi:hypothetical protein
MLKSKVVEKKEELNLFFLGPYILRVCIEAISNFTVIIKVNNFIEYLHSNQEASDFFYIGLFIISAANKQLYLHTANPSRYIDLDLLATVSFRGLAWAANFRLFLLRYSITLLLLLLLPSTSELKSSIFSFVKYCCLQINAYGANHMLLCT